MTHLELLAHFYQAFKTNDVEYAELLQRKFPVECEQILELVLATETASEFKDLVSTLTK